MYQLIEIESQTPLIDDDGKVKLFENVNDAVSFMQEISRITFKKYRPQIIIDNKWKFREELKFNRGEYIEPKWIHYGFKQITVKDDITGNEKIDFHYTHKDYCRWDSNYKKFEPIQDHFLHISAKDKTKLAFTPNAEYGMLDRQTQVNVAKYLIDHHGFDELMARHVSQLHAKLYGETELYFAETENEIYNIFVNGPDSCMGGEAIKNGNKIKKDDDYFQSYISPVRVYGDSDFSLAYIKDQNNRITARCLVNKEKKAYFRSYGDSTILDKVLIDNGYEKKFSAMIGMKFKKIYDQSKDQYLAPYLDCYQVVKHFNDRYFEICENDDKDAEFICNSTIGFIDEYSPIICEECNDRLSQDDYYSVHTSRYNTMIMCERCCNRHASYCEGFGEYVLDSEITIIDGESNPSWETENANYCDYREEYTFEECLEVITNNNGRTENWSTSCVNYNTFTCNVDGLLYANHLMHNDSGIAECNYIENDENDGE